VLPKEHVAKKTCLPDDTGDRLLQESSTYEDIEATLLSLPAPKRRRVRKRKTKQDTREEPAQRQLLPRAQEKVPKPVVSDTDRNGHIRFSNEESHTSECNKSSDEVELPYRNLNRTMKARVIRAVSPSALIDRSCRNGSEPSAATTTEGVANESANIEQTQSIAKPNIKARIVRATNGSTVAVKQEQLEASAMEQSYHPQTTVDDTEVIEIDAPTHVNGEEHTHGETPATPAV
uniref:Uncharacterized protein n=1 Tax=Anopheles maculatus TaxID=74869 RepID=A0A182SJ45_9DIPT